MAGGDAVAVVPSGGGVVAAAHPRADGRWGFLPIAGRGATGLDGNTTAKAAAGGRWGFLPIAGRIANRLAGNTAAKTAAERGERPWRRRT
jgi:hypothetical protein